MNHRPRLKWAWLLAPLVVLGALLVAPLDGQEVRALRIGPDATLPEVPLSIDLGERRYSQKEEEEGAKEVEEFYAQPGRVIYDERLQARLETMLHRIVTAAHELGPKQVPVDAEEAPPQTFTIRVLASSDVNAFSAWGGNIFITRGMLEFCQSDDELAGVIAHEVAHSTYRHLREQSARLRRYQAQQLLAMIAAGFMGINVADAGIMAQYVYLALFNGHSVSDEQQSDYAGVYYAYRAGYNPVGMITTFERLHRWQMTQPMPNDLGAFQTHPWSDARARALSAQLKELGLPIDRRSVTHTLTAMVRTSTNRPGAALLYVANAELFEVAAEGERDGLTRAADMTLDLNQAFLVGLRSGSLSLRHDEGEANWRIVGLAGLRGVHLITITPADAELGGEPLPEFAQRVYNRLRAAFRQAEVEAGVA